MPIWTVIVWAYLTFPMSSAAWHVSAEPPATPPKGYFYPEGGDEHTPLWQVWDPLARTYRPYCVVPDEEMECEGVSYFRTEDPGRGYFTVKVGGLRRYCHVVGTLEGMKAFSGDPKAKSTPVPSTPPQGYFFPDSADGDERAPLWYVWDPLADTYRPYCLVGDEEMEAEEVSYFRTNDPTRDHFSVVVMGLRRYCYVVGTFEGMKDFSGFPREDTVVLSSEQEEERPATTGNVGTVGVELDLASRGPEPVLYEIDEVPGVAVRSEVKVEHVNAPAAPFSSLRMVYRPPDKGLDEGVPGTICIGDSMDFGGLPEDDVTYTYFYELARVESVVPQYCYVRVDDEDCHEPVDEEARDGEWAEMILGREDN